MSEKASVFRWRSGETVKYGAMPFMLGIYEFQLGVMDAEMAGLYEQ